MLYHALSLALLAFGFALVLYAAVAAWRIGREQIRQIEATRKAHPEQGDAS